jgi:GntR family transcriptional regulator, transcriptional repressor for pyruvate dehydrogenase complex
VIRTMLVEQAWAPGTKLPSELELGRQLGVGRSTIREALRVLAHLGIVESRTGLGTYVVDSELLSDPVEDPGTPKKVQELYEFRLSLEVPAARMAAERRTPAQLRKIRTTWRACEEAVKNDNAQQFAELDFRFHLSVIEASQNLFFVHAYSALESKFASHVNLILALGHLKSMLHFHDGLIDAIAGQDPEAAALAVKENFLETDVRIRLLSQREARRARSK